MAIVYALCCLCFSSVNDFVFKLFAARKTSDHESCGLFVTIVGLTEVLLLLWLPRSSEHFSVTLLWGALGGLFSLVSNILLIESMKYQSAGTSSTIFRLNMVLVAIAAIILFDEPLTWSLAIGIFCAMLAILSFVPRTKGTAAENAAAVRKGFLLSILACVLRASMGLSYKYGFDHGADVNAVTIITGLFWVLGGPCYTLFREHKLYLPDKNDILIGLTSGLFVTGIVFFMARMNACGNASVVNPVAQMSFLGTFILSVVFLKERLTSQKLIAILLGCVAIVFLTLK